MEAKKSEVLVPFIINKSQLYNNVGAAPFKDIRLKKNVAAMKQKPSFTIGPKTATCMLLACALIVTIPILLITVYPYPLHASCTVSWNVSTVCPYVQMVLLHEIKGTPIRNEHASYYEIEETTSNTIKAHKVFPIRNTVYDIFLEFQGNNSCEILASSWARPWYIIFDKGTSYCNLYKLAVESGLQRMSNFTERTCNAQCTQYDVALCRVYKWWMP